MSPQTRSLEAALKNRGQEIGFDLVGIAPAVTPEGFHRFQDWLRDGHSGEMDYLPNREAAYEHPEHVLESVRSVIMLAVSYNATGMATVSPVVRESPDPVYPRNPRSGRWNGRETVPQRGATADNETKSPRDDPPASVPGRVAKYAQGSADYHDVLKGMLRELAEFLHEHRPGCRTRGVVDTAPLLERDFARLAGLGWFGKNTMLINKRAGSWLFLAALLTDVELSPDEPHNTSHCGTCTRCLDVCPTDAFPEPYVLDARRCISYLNIELRGPMPAELREGVGDWLFGCDLCQDVCPWNNKAPTTDRPEFQPSDDLSPADAVEILQMDEAAFRERFRHTPLSRPKRAGLLRNAAIVLGNSGRAEAVQPLIRTLQDREPLVRGAVAWALGNLGGEAARTALRNRLAVEKDNTVRGELIAALTD